VALLPLGMSSFSTVVYFWCLAAEDVASFKNHTRQHGIADLFETDGSNKTPIEIAFTEGAQFVGIAMIQALQNHIEKLESVSGGASWSNAITPTASVGLPADIVAAAAIAAAPSPVEDSATTAAASTHQCEL
jgi:hypothetical protein